MQNRIRELRKEQHMTQVRLSIELEVAQETISAYESGKYTPSVSILIKMSQIFGASCDYILGLSEHSNPNASSLNGLTFNEHYVLEIYRNLPMHKKEIFCAYLKGLSEM